MRGSNPGERRGGRKKARRTERTDAAKAAAPYVHPRFEAVAPLPITDDYDLALRRHETLCAGQRTNTD